MASSEDGAVSTRSAPKFLPLEGTQKSKKNRARQSAFSNFDSSGKRKSAVLYVGRIPHGFYEDQMRGYFSQFGAVKRLRLSRNKKTGKSKHFAFLEFESPEVAEIVAECMDNYLFFGSMLQVKSVPLEKIHPKLWNGANHKFIVYPWRKIARQQFNEEKDPEQQKVLVNKFLSKEKKRKSKLKAAGIDYEYLQIEAPPAPKKIIFDEAA